MITVLVINQGRIQEFFLGEGALVSCSTSTPINHIAFFCRIPVQVVLENRSSYRGGGEGGAPPAPSPRSLDSQSIEQVIDSRCVFRAEKKKEIIKKIVFPYDHLVSVTLKYHRKNNFLIRYSTNEPPHKGHLGDRRKWPSNL